MYLNTVFKYNVFKYCPALSIADMSISFQDVLLLSCLKDKWAYLLKAFTPRHKQSHKSVAKKKVERVCWHALLN